MICGMYSIRDRIAEQFRSVVIDTNDMTAKRNFAYAVNNEAQMLYQAKDLELCKIAEFDTVTGIVNPIVPCMVVCRGDEVIEDDKKK